MRPATLLIVLAFAAATPPQAAISYFTNVREVAISSPAQQNYISVDEEIWNHSRPDLGDLRLYAGDTQIPYALREQAAGIRNEEKSAKILNLGSSRGQTSFVIDLNGIPEYDRVRLQLDARDFLVTAGVDGQNDLTASQRTRIGSTTLYDFSHEELGSNSVLKLPPSTFRYLHVTLSPGIRPDQVKGASVSNIEEKKASWVPVQAKALETENGRQTVILLNLPPKMPVDRITFVVPARRVNFRRAVTMITADGTQITHGDISRIRMTRAGQTAVSENLDLDLPDMRTPALTITVENGDDPPLGLAVKAFSIERRIYFDPQGKTALKLYFGDQRLSPPVYDYAKFFRAEDVAARAELGPGTHNAAYASRPDERPWSERHSGIMWGAMIAAVGILALLALRGLKPTPPPSRT